MKQQLQDLIDQNPDYKQAYLHTYRHFLAGNLLFTHCPDCKERTVLDGLIWHNDNAVCFCPRCAKPKALSDRVKRTYWRTGVFCRPTREDMSYLIKFGVLPSYGTES